MYRTTSVLALGLFLGLAPIGAVAQTQKDTETQVTQPADSGQSTETDVLKTDDQQSTETDTMKTDDQQSTETDTMKTDDQQSTETDVLKTDEQQSTETEVLDTDQQSTETEVLENDQQSTETEVLETDQQSTETEVLGTDEPAMTTDAGATKEVIPAQEESEMLASSLMGAEVNLADESIGKVSDLIVSNDFMIKGVVVGVGGFLGIGEKNVALPMEQITIRPTEEPGEVELSANTTREELEAFDEFKTASEVRAEIEAGQAAQQAESQQPAAVPTEPAQQPQQ